MRCVSATLTLSYCLLLCLMVDFGSGGSGEVEHLHGSFTQQKRPMVQEVTTRGVINTFRRYSPFVLFRTSLGMQLLNGNGTCFNVASLYAPSVLPIDYVTYAYADNYIGWVNKKANQFCSKYLFHE